MRLAWLALLACGSPPRAMPDAAGDGPGIVTAPLVVFTTTHVLGGGLPGAPAPLTDVIAVRPDGSVSDMVKTDDAGHASVNVTPGGSVTAIYPHVIDHGVDLVTFMGVSPGETLTFGQRTFPFASDDLGSMQLDWPALNTAVQMEAFTPCSVNPLSPPSGGSVQIEAFASCAPQPYDVSFIAVDPTGALTGYGFLSVPQFTAGSIVSLPSWSSPTSFTSTFTGLPAESSGLQFTINQIGAGATLFQTGLVGTATNDAFSTTLLWAPVGDRTFAQLSLQRGGGQYPPITVDDALPAFSSLWTVTPDTKYPPWLAGELASGAARAVAYFPVTTAQATTFDAAVMQMQWTRADITGGTMTFDTYNWAVISPPEQTSYDLPALPDPFAADMPTQDDAAFGTVRLIEIPTVDDYASLEAIGERDLVCPECAVREGVFPRILTSN